MRKDKIVILDLDGTIANIEHRIHHIKPEPGEKKNWSSFFHASKDDTVYAHVKSLIDMLSDDNLIVSITGRPDNLRGDTLDWLDKHGIPVDILLMRPSSERKPDYEVKKDLLIEFLESSNRTLADVKMVFEDRLPVAKMWHDLDLPVLLCGSEWLDSDWGD